MLTRWYDIERNLAALDELARQMERVFGASAGLGPRLERAMPLGMLTWPPASLYDSGSALTAVLQVPGLAESDLKVEVHGDALTVSGERKVSPPEGYQVHRNERASRTFSRSFGLPCRVDGEKVTAKLKDGLLTVTMSKHPEAQPKQISVSAG